MDQNYNFIYKLQLRHLKNAKKLALRTIKTTKKNILVQIIPCLVS